ncbi:hypothetical protein GCM10010185_46580 [Saccharothrix coeruleofusca]|uniref:Uncharacterized protein n=1 Tax=Saccharothrix coeruleofusca TaxID=33919 RepID=A0A918EGF9_9PSEU|nr:hypothetical protein GCM10010185_46580 [Saccharothrix coeruleofusca]
MVPCAEAVGVQTNMQASVLTISAMMAGRLATDPEVLRIRMNGPPLFGCLSGGNRYWERSQRIVSLYVTLRNFNETLSDGYELFRASSGNRPPSLLRQAAELRRSRTAREVEEQV